LGRYALARRLRERRQSVSYVELGWEICALTPAVAAVCLTLQIGVQAMIDENFWQKEKTKGHTVETSDLTYFHELFDCLPAEWNMLDPSSPHDLPPHLTNYIVRQLSQEPKTNLPTDCPSIHPSFPLEGSSIIPYRSVSPHTPWNYHC
jgi:hypothetical protein